MSDLAKRIARIIGNDVLKTMNTLMTRYRFNEPIPPDDSLHRWEKWIDEELAKSYPHDHRYDYCDAADMPLTLEEQAVEDRSKRGK